MDVATAGSAGLSGDGQNWSNNPSKYNASYSDGGISYSGYSSPIKGKDVVYVDFPITAKQNLELEQIIISFGNHGTGNVAASVQLIRSGVSEELFADTSRKARQVRKTFPLGEKITANETIKIRVALYGYANEDTQIDTGKAPTIGTVQISGRAEKNSILTKCRFTIGLFNNFFLGKFLCINCAALIFFYGVFLWAAYSVLFLRATVLWICSSALIIIRIWERVEAAWQCTMQRGDSSGPSTTSRTRHSAPSSSMILRKCTATLESGASRTMSHSRSLPARIWGVLR